HPAPPRRDHGRQRPLGPAAPPPARDRPPRRRARGQPVHRFLPGQGHRGPDPVRVLERELGPARGRGRGADEAVHERARPRGRRAAPARRAHRLHRRARAVFRGDPHAHGEGRGADRRQHHPRAEHRRQLRRPPGHRRRRARPGRGRGRRAPATGADRRGAVRRPGRPRGPAAAGPVHPHRRRLPHQQLPAVAARLHRALVHRNVVARAGCGDTAARARRLRQPRTPLRPDRRAGGRHPARGFRMTRTRVIAALILTPIAIAAILLLPTPWLAALAAVVFLAGLWEWFRLADVEDTLARTILRVVNLALMVAIVWGSRTSHGFSYVLLQLGTVIGVAWWLVALIWLRHFEFGADHSRAHARISKLAAGTLAIVPAWCALGVLHGSEDGGHRWLFIALAIVWAADSGAYFAGRRFGKRKL